MPYSTPATPTSPSSSLPGLSSGRPGHRRSYSHISLPATAMATPTSSSSSSSSASSSASTSPEIASATYTAGTTNNYGSGAYAPLGSLPRRRSASSHAALTNNNSHHHHHHHATTMNDIMNSPAMTALQANANGPPKHTITTPTTLTTPTATTSHTHPGEPSTPTSTAKKPTFQLGHDDDDDDSSSDETNKRKTAVGASTSSAAVADNHAKNSTAAYRPKPQTKQSDTDDDGRALPPLRLKQRPGAHVHGHHVPFPRTASPRNSPRSSPRHSPTGSPATSHAPLLPVYVRPALVHTGRSVSSSASGSYATAPSTPLTVNTVAANNNHNHNINGNDNNGNGTSTATVTISTTSPTPNPNPTTPNSNTTNTSKPVAPPMMRTVSSPVLYLSNGKPLKSSLKGSSSSSSIPFPPQSMVPSRMGIWLAPPPVDGLPGNGNGHQRAASAPNSPLMTPDAGAGAGAASGSGGSSGAGADGQVPFPSPETVKMPMSPLVLVNENAEKQHQQQQQGMPSFGAALSSLPPPLDASSSASSSSSISSLNSGGSGSGSGAAPPDYLLSPLNMPGFADVQQQQNTSAHVRSQSHDVLLPNANSNSNSNTNNHPQYHNPHHPAGYYGHQHTQSLSIPSTSTHSHSHVSQPTTPVAKTVHFPTPDSGGLATVKLYNKGGRPASLLRLGEETETETEGESSAREWPARWGGWMSGFGGFGAAGKAWGRGGGAGAGAGGGSSSNNTPTNGHSVGVNGRQSASSQNQAGYPFPKVMPLAPQLTRGDSSSSGTASGGGAAMQRMREVVTVETVVEVDGANSSPVPARGAQRGEGNVYLESIGFAKGTAASTAPGTPAATAATPADRLLLVGTLLVRNVAYLKTVAVRFTLDDWHTTTDVLARYERSLHALPPRFVRAASGELIRGHTVAEQNRGRVCHPDDVDQEFNENKPATEGAETEKEREKKTSEEEDKPAWDRFRFEIALGAHGQSLSTLEGRVMWLVGRYSAGVDVADAVVVVPPAAASSAVPQSASVERLDEVLAARKPAQEWWDNNAGCNYRIGFVKKEIVVRTQIDAAAEERKAAEEKRAAEERLKSIKAKEAEAMMKEVEKANGAYRRGLHVSAPSVYPASSPSPKSYPAPPQISSSVSFPGPSSPPGTTYARYQQQQSQLQQKQHQEAVVQSTMARLKKLNLRNYAAPAKYTPPPPAQEKKLPEEMVPSTSTSTSADSTPLQTPTQVEDDEREQAFNGESKNGTGNGGASAGYVDVQGPRNDDDPDRTPTFQGALARPTWGASESEAGSELGIGMNMSATTFMGSMTMMMENGFPASVPTSAASLSAPGLDAGMMGSSPPFSAMTSADVGASLSSNRAAKSAMAANANSALYWPWGSGDAGKTATTPATSAAVNTNGKESEPASSASAPATTPPITAPVASLLSGIQEKSTSGAPVGSHIVPPQRRRGVHYHPQQLSSGGSSSSLSSLSNGNGSGSDSGSNTQTYGTRPRHARTTSSSSVRTSPQIMSASFGPGSGISAPVPVRKESPTMWGLRSNSPRPGSPRPNGGYSFGNSLSVNASREGGTRSPLRLSPVNSSAAIDTLASNGKHSSPVSASGPSTTSNGSTSAASGSDTEMPMSPGAGQDDAVYQAFVRQWCFAQAPGPTAGASAGAAGAQTPAGTTPRGEAGPRLVVS